ncbi:MAG: ATP-binding cassette domain-containing protein [Pseudomonadota bacterium]
MTLFQIKNLRKVYGNRTVLDIPELDLKKGVRYALVGSNGAGKTTLLEILSLLNRPTAGTMIYNNRPVDFASSHLHTLRRKIGLVQQNPVLFTTTVYKNLEFGLKIRGTPKDERNRIIAESLDLVGMRQFISAKAHKLSGGETQRVAIARALAVNPEVLLCDEPFASVDVENQAAIINILRQANELKNVTIIFTTHNHYQVTSLAQHILFLNHGKLAPDAGENFFNPNFS